VLVIDGGAVEGIKGLKTVALPAPAQWADTVAATFGGKTKVDAAWPAAGAERTWTHAGTSRVAPTAKGK
jgi:aconitate hydratase